MYKLFFIQGVKALEFLRLCADSPDHQNGLGAFCKECDARKVQGY